MERSKEPTIATLIHAEWLSPAVTGPPELCAESVRGQLDLGAYAAR